MGDLFEGDDEEDLERADLVAPLLLLESGIEWQTVFRPAVSIFSRHTKICLSSCPSVLRGLTSWRYVGSCDPGNTLPGVPRTSTLIIHHVTEQCLPASII